MEVANHPEHGDERRSDHPHLEESRDKTKHQSRCRSGLEDDDRFFFSIPEPPGSVQAERGENDMPEIEKAQKNQEDSRA